MGIQLTDDEVAEFLATRRTGVLTTVRRDGMPLPVPLWFASRGTTIECTTPRASKKVRRIERDDRASFLVEAGEGWRELKAVILVGRAVISDDAEAVLRINNEIALKYAHDLQPPTDAMPAATREHYARQFVAIRFEPTEPPITWDNAKIRLGSA